VTDCDSQSDTLSEMHGLTASQLSELQGAVQALDSYLLICVHELRNNRWDRPNTKHVADCLVRELVVFFSFPSSFLYGTHGTNVFSSVT
jgi:hypothetical protein